MAYECIECSITKFDAPMIKDELWLSIAAKRDILCLDCMEKRLGRSITRHDLNDSPWSKAMLRLIERTEAGTF